MIRQWEAIKGLDDGGREGGQEVADSDNVRVDGDGV